MATMRTRRAYMGIVYGDEERNFSVPIFTDSKATIDIALNDRGTPRTRHMGRRQLYVRYCKQSGAIILYHVAGDKFQIADIGTKGDIDKADFEYKCAIMEAPSGNEATKVLLQSHRSRRGVLELSSCHPGPSVSVTMTETVGQGDVISSNDANA